MYKAIIYFAGWVADPAHLVAATLPEVNVVFSGTRWQRFLIKLLSRSLLKQYNKNQEVLKKNPSAIL